MNLIIALFASGLTRLLAALNPPHRSGARRPAAAFGVCLLVFALSVALTALIPGSAAANECIGG